MEQLINQFSNAMGSGLTSVLGALLFLIVGYFIALIVKSLAKKLMASLNINGRVNGSSGKGLDVESIGSKLVFWFIFLFALTGALSQLELTAVSAPLATLLDKVTSFLPGLIGAIILGGIAWVIATFVKGASQKALSATSLDAKLGSEGQTPISTTLSNVFYGIVILFFLPMILEKLGMQSILSPVQGMFTKILDFLPNLFGAAIIFVIGYFIAKLVRDIVTNIVASFKIEAVAKKAGLKDVSSLPKLAGTIVFVLIMMPVVISALDKLKIEAISRPATNMLNNIMDTVPSVISAAAVLIITYFIFRFVSNLVTEVLSSAGVDALPEKMGISQIFGSAKVSAIVGNLIFVLAMLFAVIAAAELVSFTSMRDLVTKFMEFGSQIFFGAVILVVGFWLANLVSDIVARSENSSPWIATLVKVVIMGLVLAMGLKSMGIADSIVNMAFGLTLGSAAVAFAIAFGLGGREAAARVLKNSLDKIEK